jgi:hypothetical protein
MPLCPQIVNTPVPVTLTGDFTVTNVVPVLAANTEQLAVTNSAAVTALADATAALAAANTAYTTAVNSLQASAYAIQNPSTKQLTAIDATGLTVYVNSPTSGPRVVMNSAGLAGYNSGGTATFSISASTGNATFAGDIVTGARIIGGTMNIGGNAIIDSSGFLTATGANITGTITATSGSFTGSVTSTSGTIGGWTLTSTKLYSGSSELNASTGNAVFNGMTAFGQIYGYSSLYVTTTGQFVGNLTASAYLINSGIAIQNGTAVHILTGGRLVQSTSSERFKKNIVTIPEGGWLDKVTQIRPVNFQYDEAYCEAPDEVISGLIAEDIAEIPGFEHLIVNDPLGDPFSVGYDRLTVFLVLAIKELKAELDQLKGA